MLLPPVFGGGGAVILRVVVFGAGAALMGLEIVGSRVLAPYFGSSVYVWGSLISIFLAALSVGYYVGGQVADRWPRAAVRRQPRRDRPLHRGQRRRSALRHLHRRQHRREVAHRLLPHPRIRGAEDSVHPGRVARRLLRASGCRRARPPGGA